MRPLDSLQFAEQSFRGHRVRSGLSLLGIAIGVAAVVLLTSLGEGARRYVAGEFSSLGSNLLIVVPGKTETSGMATMVGEAPNDLTVRDSEAILNRVPTIRNVAPVAMGTATIRAGSRSRQVTIIGSTESFFSIRKLELAGGTALPGGTTGTTARVCVVGSKIQREIFGGESPLGQHLRVGDYRFRIIGVLAPKGTTLGLDVDDMVYVPVTLALRMFDQSSLFRIFVEVGAHRDIPRAREEAVAVLTNRHGEEDVTIITQDSILSTFDDILTALTAALAGIAAISLTVAGIGIMNVMLITVSERTREIGLLKAIGATRRQIVSIFLLEAAILSFAGGGVGLGLGLAAGALSRRLYPEFPVQAPLWAVAAALIVSLLVGIGFGALPARRAARLDPVVALAAR